MIATFLTDPDGEVSRRTAYAEQRAAGDGEPSFTILSNRCVHLGCPVQVNGLPLDEENGSGEPPDGHAPPVTDADAPRVGLRLPLPRRLVRHRGQPHRRPAGRALDRYHYAIDERPSRPQVGATRRRGRGQGRRRGDQEVQLADPSVHVDGPEQILYPIQAPH